MNRFRRVRHHRRRQHTSESDHDNGSESEECIDNISSSTSSSSDSESDDEDSLPGAWKARSLKNDDSDNDSTSSSNDSDSDSNEDAVNNKENQSGAAISRAIRIHSQFKYNDDEKEALQEPSTSLHDTNRPLSPWTNSSSKARIIDDLKNNKSSIHALVGSGWEANLDDLWKHYDPQYQRSKFKGYMTTIMNHYCRDVYSTYKTSTLSLWIKPFCTGVLSKFLNHKAHCVNICYN